MAPDIKSILKNRKVLAGIGVAVVAVIVLAVTAGGTRAKTALSTRETALVARGELKLSVEAKGQFQAENSLGIYPEIRGQATITFLVPDGSQVKKDDLLASLSTDELQTRIDSQALRFENSRNRVTQAQQTMKMLASTNEASLTAAEVALKMAKLAADQYGEVALKSDGSLDSDVYSKPGAPTKGDAYQAFRDAELDITRAESDLERAITDFDGMEKLLAKGFISRSEFLAGQLAVDEARRALESKKLAYDLLKDYTYPQTRAKNLEAVKTAESGLASAKISADIKMNQAETSARTAKLEYDRLDGDLTRRREEFVKRTIKAPVDGTVLYGDPSMPPWHREHISVGQMIWRGMRLFTIPDLSSIVVKTRLLEMDFYTAPVGKDVEVTVDAIPGVVMRGKLTKVAEYATEGDDWGGGGTAKAFDAMVKMDSTDSRIKPGMSCTVEIVQDRLADVLYVPVNAVFRKGDKDIATLVDGGADRTVEVKTGRVSEKYVEILSGLSEGQKVLVNENAPATAGAAASKKAGS